MKGNQLIAEYMVMSSTDANVEPRNAYRTKHVYMGMGTLKGKGGMGWMSAFGDPKVSLVYVEFDGYIQSSRILMVGRSGDWMQLLTKYLKRCVYFVRIF